MKIDLKELEALQRAACIALPVKNDDPNGNIESADGTFVLYDEGGASEEQSAYVVAMLNAGPDLIAMASAPAAPAVQASAPAAAGQISRIELLGGIYITRHPTITRSGSMWWMHSSHSLLRALTASECELVTCSLAAPQQHAPSLDLSRVTCWVEGEDGALCEAIARASDIKDPDNAFVRLSAVLRLVGGVQQHAQPLPKWIDDAKGRDPFTDSLIAYIEGHPTRQQAQAPDPIGEHNAAPVAAAVQGDARPFHFGLGDEQVAIKAAETLGMIGVPLNAAGAINLAHGFMKLRKQDSERDAVRYRWLRHGNNDDKVIQRGPVADDFVYLPRNLKLDEMIDAAMAAQKPEKGGT